MQLLFLGTGSGKTSLVRGHTSILIRNGRGILVDCGEGTSSALLKYNISYDEIDSVVISHFHADHIAGLPGLLTQMKINGRTSPVDLYVHEDLKDILLNLLNSFYLFKEGFTFTINIIGFRFGLPVSLTKDLEFKGIKNGHIINKYNVDYISEEKFVSSSFLFTAGEKNIFFTADIGAGSDLMMIDEKCDYIISETTHIPPEKLLPVFVKHEPEKIFLTHIEDETKLEAWYSTLDKKLKKYFVITFDGMELEI